MSRAVLPPVRPELWSDRAPPQRPARISPVVMWSVVAVLMACYTGIFLWLSLTRYWAYEMHALDMGNMGQAAWNTIHGNPFWFTNMRLPYNIEAWRTTTRLSFHVEALFPVISLVYLIYAHPESLLVLQTLALVLGAIPVYLLARDVLQSPSFALVFVLAYLLFPTLEAMNLYEFHPVALATPLLLFAFWFGWRRQYLPFTLCCLAAIGTKEEMGLIVAMFGLYVAVFNGERRVGLGIAAFGVFCSLVAVLVVEHHFRQPGTVTYLHTRYGYLGHGISGALHTVIYNPGVFAQVLFTWPKLGYLQRLLAPVGFTALLSPAGLLLGAPTFVLNLFSTEPSMYSGVGHNSAELISVVMIAGILGARRGVSLLQLWMPRARASLVVAIYVLVMAISNHHFNGFTPLSAYFQAPSIGRHQHLADKFVAMVPASAPVSTQDQLDPHLSSRRYLYLFADTGRWPPPLAPASYILLDVGAPTYPLPSTQLYSYAKGWINHTGWGVAAAEDGLILIKKGAHSRSVPPRFYSFAVAGSTKPQFRLRGSEGGLAFSGYDVQRVDVPNFRIPNLAYTFYLRPQRSVGANLQPVVYELQDRSLVGCSAEPLGLAWLPPSYWRPGYTYRVTMQPLQTNSQTPGTASLFVELRPSLGANVPSCSSLWKKHGRLWKVGTQNIQF